MSTYDDFTKTKLIIDRDVNKIHLKGMTFTNIIIEKPILFDALFKLIIDEENLIYYLTQNSSSQTPVKTRAFIKKLISSGMLENKVSSILQNLGMTSTQSDTALKGSLGEYLMAMLIDKLGISETLTCKVSLKTSPKMPPFGNDNLFYDYENEILYYGESKFYNDFEEALNDAISSLKKHNTYAELDFLKNATNSFISHSFKKLKRIQEKFDSINLKNISIKHIVFITNGIIYSDIDYIDTFNKCISKPSIDKGLVDETIFAFLPIFSTDEFVEYFRNKVKTYE